MKFFILCIFSFSLFAEPSIVSDTVKVEQSDCFVKTNEVVPQESNQNFFESVVKECDSNQTKKVESTN